MNQHQIGQRKDLRRIAVSHHGRQACGPRRRDPSRRDRRPLPTWVKAMDLGNRAYRSSSLTVTVTRP